MTGSRNEPGLHIDLVTSGNLCEVIDVGYVRDAARSWSTWSSIDDRPMPLFNWVSVFNFNRLDARRDVVFAIDIDGEAQALMMARIGHIVRCDATPRIPLVYVAFLEVAPWNSPSVENRVFRGLGPIMLRIACDVSSQRGFEGRIGLHSVSAARDFYRRVGLCDQDCPSEFNELYMELDEHGAERLLTE